MTSSGAAPLLPPTGEPARLRAPLPEDELLEVVGGIGPKVRALRTLNSLSLQQLADRSDVSPAAIHKVEGGTMVPTITTLLKLAAALDRPVSFFVDEDPSSEPPYTLIPADDRQAVPTTLDGIDLGRITGVSASFTMSGAIAELEPHASSGEKPLRHPGEEVIHVLTGVIEVTVADSTVRLTAGDTIHFETHVDHRWRNPSSRRARAVWMTSRRV